MSTQAQLSANVTRARPAPRVNKGIPRMFESNFWEALSHVHPATPAVLYLPLVGFSLYRASAVAAMSPLSIVLHVLVGYITWTVFEYWLHRLLFHIKVVGPRTQRLYFLIHGVHHDYPWDITRLVIPMPASLTLAVLFWFGFQALFGDRMYPLFAGFVGGYVAYDTIHWYVHARIPKTRFGRWLRREHMVHHFKEPESRFGVSCPWMDHVFGTTGESQREDMGPAHGQA